MLVLVLLAALAVPASLWAAGGDDIANPPELPTNVRQYSAKFGPDYWRVFLNVGDLMTVDYSSTDGDKVSFCLLPPSSSSTDGTSTTPTVPVPTPDDTGVVPPATTTTTLTDDMCAGRDTTFTKSRITLSVVNPPGYWTLAFADGLCAPHNYDTTCKTYDVAYSATLTVRRFTQTLLTVANVAERRTQITASGRVIGMTGGYIQLAIQREGTWRTIDLVPLNATGQYFRKFRLPSKPGRYPFRATFYGDDEHRPSGRSTVIRVV